MRGRRGRNRQSEEQGFQDAASMGQVLGRETPPEVQAEKVDTPEFAAISRVEIDQLVSTAKAYPRDVVEAKREALAIATMDMETAEECFYRYERGGKAIEGPSVRAAEIVLSTWGNIRAGCRVLGHDNKNVFAQGFCHDVQRNVFMVREVQRKITNSDGDLFSEDMITVTGNAAAMIAFRNAVFVCIPKVLTRSIYLEAKKVACGDAKSIKDRWAKTVQAFARFGVKEEDLLAKIGKKAIDEVKPDDLATLIGLGTAIREGETTIEAEFGTGIAADPKARVPEGAASSTPPPANGKKNDAVEAVVTDNVKFLIRAQKDHQKVYEKACQVAGVPVKDMIEFLEPSKIAELAKLVKAGI